ncbi:MAG: Colicin production protein [Gammaproteobacteria bacterium]|jgi:membrane protein required for colicin V production|nr:Colicin production protein [Gammaproteobacteria bacterium]
MSGLDINWIDLGIILLIGTSVIFGFVKGFFRSVVSVLTWIAAIAISMHYGPSISDKFSKVSSQQDTRLIMAYVVLFMAVILLGLVVKIIMEAIISFTGLSLVDRALGALFGVVRGIFVVTLVVFLLSLSSIAAKDVWKQSKLVPYFMDIASWAEDIALHNEKPNTSEQKTAVSTQVSAKAHTANKTADNLSD